MAQLEGVMSELLLRIFPNAIFWGLVFLIILFLALKFSKASASESGLLVALSILAIAPYLGGFFDIMSMLLMAVIGILLVMAFFKIGNR